MKLLRVKLQISRAFRPQIYEQSESEFRTLHEFLRCFESYTQRDWSKQLQGLEFAYKNSMSKTTKHTPCFLEHGQLPLSVSDFQHPDGSETLMLLHKAFWRT